MKVLSVIFSLIASYAFSMQVPYIKIPQSQPSMRNHLAQLSPPCIKKSTSKYNIIRGILDSYLILHEITELRSSHQWNFDALNRDTASSERYETLLREFAQNVHDIDIGASAQSPRSKKRANKNYSSLPLLKQAEDVLRNEKKKQVEFFMTKLGGWIENDVDNNFGQNIPASEEEYVDEFERIREMYTK